jgi:hypothetical protein
MSRVFQNIDPQPSLRPASVPPPPPGPKGGGSNTPLRMRRVGDPIRTTGKKAWRSVYSVSDTVYSPGLAGP